MKKTLMAILALAWVWAGAPLSAQSSAPAPALTAAEFFAFLGAADRQRLFGTGELSASATRVGELPYGRRSPFAAALATELTVTESTVALESFSLFARPAGEVTLGLYNALNAVASMAGIQYYSLSQKKMETLILTSSRVAAAGSDQKLPDPVFTAVPPLQRAVVFQKDNRLGDGYSELVYKQQNGGLSVTVRNLSPLTYTFLPLVDPGNLQMTFFVLPLADKIAVYAVLSVKTAALLGLEHSRDENFRNRLRALAAWFGSRVAGLIKS